MSSLGSLYIVARTVFYILYSVKTCRIGYILRSHASLSLSVLFEVTPWGGGPQVAPSFELDGNQACDQVPPEYRTIIQLCAVNSVPVITW